MGNIGRYDLSGMEEQVKMACDKARTYIDAMLNGYYLKQRKTERAPLKPVLAFLGWGRAGKDTSAKIFCEHVGGSYTGSASDAVAPIICHSIGVSKEIAFAHRHEHRQYWFEWCNEFRRNDPSKIARMMLSKSDVVVGMRSKIELLAAKKEGVVSLAIWVENPRAERDFTVEFSRSDCDIVLDNESSKEVLATRVVNLANCIWC